MKVCIVGMGEIGSGLYSAMNSSGIDEIVGVDVNPKRVEALKSRGFNVTSEIPLDQNVYVISVLLSEQVVDVIVSNKLPENALIVVESTIAPGAANCIIGLKPWTKLVLFPHRYDPDSVEKHGFLNLSKDFVRVMGAANEKVKGEALEFYSRYLDTGFVHSTSMEVAELVKPLENAYRFLEIAVAEELKMILDRKGIPFDEVRNAVNSKWNTNIKNAMNGIGRHCLPKDIRIMNSFLEGNSFFKTAIEAEQEYRRYLAANGIEPAKVIETIGKDPGPVGALIANSCKIALP